MTAPFTRLAGAASLALVMSCVAPVAPSSSGLVEVDEELRSRFDDAALYCDQRLLTIPLSAVVAASLGDTALDAYASTRRRFTASPRIAQGPHAGEPVALELEISRNACRFGTSVEFGGSLPALRMVDGFCRADINHCLGRELEAHATTLGSGAAQAPLKAALLRVARERLSAASAEYLSSLAFYDRVCISEPGGTFALYAFECTTRLQPTTGPSYLPVVYARLVEGIERIVELAQLESELRIDLGDAAARAARLVDTPDRIADLFGPEGSRTAGVAALYGLPDGVSFERVFNARRLRPVSLPFLEPPDERVARALELIRRFRAPMPFARTADAGPIQVALADFSPELTYVVLDHRVAAARFLSPYDQVEAGDPMADLGATLRSLRPLTVTEVSELFTRPIPAHRSVLQTELDVTVFDVARAIILAIDTYETQLGRFVFEPQLHGGVAGGPVVGVRFLGLVEATAAPRPTELLAGAFVESQNVASADALAPLLDPLPALASGPGGDFYAWDLRRLDGTQAEGTFDHPVGEDIRANFGAAATLHYLRVHLLRLESVGGSLVDTVATGRAVTLIEDAIGEEWTEHDVTGDPICRCLVIEPPNQLPNDPLFPPPNDPLPPIQICPNREDQALYAPCSQCWCDLLPVQSSGVLWDLYQPESADTTGRPVAVHHVEDVRCLLQGFRPGADEPCNLSPAGLAVVGGAATTRIGRARRTYRLPPFPGWASHVYILWENADGTYRFMDAVPRDRAAGVHPLGGVFLDRASTAWSRDPWRPGRPTSSSRGTLLSLVPPLESELISDSDSYEDSFAAYLEDAAVAVATARRQLQDARNDALNARLDALSDETLLEEAALAETATLADLCGDLIGCRVARAPPVTLRDLGLITDPPLLPDLGPYASCDEVADGLFTDFHAAVSAGFGTDQEVRDFLQTHLSRGLACALDRYLTELGALRLTDLPTAVLDALATGDDPGFSRFSGRVREQLLVIFQALEEVRSTFRRLEAQRFAAETLITAAAGAITNAHQESYERELCQWSAGLSITSDVASIVSSLGAVYLEFDSGNDDWAGLGRSGSRVLGEGASITNRAQYQVATDNCNAQEAAETVAYQSAQQMVGSLGVLVGLARRARNSARSSYFTIASLDALQRRAEIAAARRDVARLMAESDSLADLPEWQALRSFSHRRAQASLERAQYALLVARRALEFRLVVDLSTMREEEPLTPPPATWADSLFDLGGAVVSVPDDEAEVSVAAEELELYLERLQRFVDGYPIARRFRDAGDVQILDLAEMLHGEPGAAITEQLIFRCSGHPVPLLAGRLPGVTTGAPCAGLGDIVQAELHFEIPAELDRYLADRLAAGSFNYRHELLAPNLVGSAVLDCERAFDRVECYADGNIPYDLRHQGPFELEGFDRERLTFFMEPGVIRNGRALVAERSLTTPLSGADRTLVTPFYRQELRGRPLSGLYSLTIHGRPEINWANLDGIQLLIGYRYWTRQE